MFSLIHSDRVVNSPCVLVSAPKAWVPGQLFGKHQKGHGVGLLTCVE